MAQSLSRIRDFLLPGLWGRNVEGDLICDLGNDTIDLVIEGRRETLITRADIDDGTFKTRFAVRLNQISDKPAGET